MRGELTAKGRATRTSKGQLFHYFPAGKDELLLAVAQGDQCPLGSLFLHLGRSTPGVRAVVIELMRR